MKIRLAKYRKVRNEFMRRPENQFCPVTGEPTTDVHHIKGRMGDLLWDVEFFLAVSRRGHTHIHEHPEEAREKGWLI
jgi:hypothetical protein